jgi:hypothetical protein
MKSRPAASAKTICASALNSLRCTLRFGSTALFGEDEDEFAVHVTYHLTVD